MNKVAKIYAKRKSQKIAANPVLVNEKGRRIGETHPAARVSDHDVELVLRLHEEGMAVKAIARKLDIPRRTVRDYVAGRCRCQCGRVKGGA